MKTVIGFISIGLVGCRREFEVDVEDDATEEEIEQAVRDEMYDIIEWGWKEDA